MLILSRKSNANFLDGRVVSFGTFAARTRGGNSGGGTRTSLAGSSTRADAVRSPLSGPKPFLARAAASSVESSVAG